MARHEASGLSGEGFCEAEGIGKSAFWRWRRRLSDVAAWRDGGGAAFVELSAAQPGSWVVGRGAGTRHRHGAAGASTGVLIPAAERRIWLCVAPTDMWRSFDGLAALARNHLGRIPPTDRGSCTSTAEGPS